MNSGHHVSSGHREHFDRIASDYSKASDTWSGVYRRIGELVRPVIAGKDVLDIGNGGFFPYDTRNARSVTVLDISPAMLDRLDAPNIRKVVGDARDLSPIPDASQDAVLYLLCLHHICGRNRPQTISFLEKIFTSADRVLRPGGSVMVAEPVTGGWVNAAERLLFPLTRAALAVKNVPMIYFHHPDDIAGRLAGSLRIPVNAVERTPLPVTGWVDPLGGSFPGVIKIPAWSLPTRYVLFRAKKPA